VRTANGWEINCEKAVVAGQRSLSFSKSAIQWSKETMHYSEIEGQAVAQIPGSK
jgi:hypothetical protein